MNCLACGIPQTGAPFKPGRTIAIEADGETKIYDFLVIACDPQDGLTEEVMKKTDTEKKVFSTDVMKSLTFQTTLMKFPKVDKVDDPVEIFNPVNLNKSEGLLHSYRSETRKEAYQLTAQSNSDDPKAFFADQLAKFSHEYVTMYQLIDKTKPEAHNMDEEQMWELLKQQMNDPKNKTWFPYDALKGEKIACFHTKYFDHFTIPALKNQTNTRRNNWRILDIQGKKNTIYVHASTAFESVLHIYSYIELLHETCPESFPDDKQSKIAVIGAGPSGLLASRKFVQLGYTDITVYESKQNNSGPNELYAGKTQTNMFSQPHLNYMIPAELGTCYLSPAYKHMYDEFDRSHLLGPAGDKNELISLDQIENGPVVKDIITDGQFDEDGPVKRLLKAYPDVLDLGEYEGDFPSRMDFEKYQVVKGFEEHYKGKNLSVGKLKEEFPGFLYKVIGPAAIKYITYHCENYGKYVPFPPNQKRVKGEIFSNDIYSFLEKKDLLCLLGLLQFGYSLQGYGSTAKGDTMSAFYLLMWVTPNVFMTFIHNDVKHIIEDGLSKIHLDPVWFKKDVPIVAALSKGWGDVWKNLKRQFEEEIAEDSRKKVTIKYGTRITKIARDKV